MKLEIRYHAAMPRWAKLVGLRIKAVPECEGGGFCIDREQAEEIIRALAQGIEAPSGGETRSGSTVGESPTPRSGDAPGPHLDAPKGE